MHAVLPARMRYTLEEEYSQCIILNEAAACAAVSRSARWRAPRGARERADLP